MAKPKPTVNRVERLKKALYFLAQKEVLVGWPEADAARKDPNELKDADITNAALAYIHDNGAPESGIPARPFMIPAMQQARGQVTDMLTHMADQVREGAGPKLLDKMFHQVGGYVASEVKVKINEGIPPPLADATVRERANRSGKSKGRKGAVAELASRAAGNAAGTDLAKPLIDTGQMRNACTYVIRNRNEREE